MGYEIQGLEKGSVYFITYSRHVNGSFFYKTGYGNGLRLLLEIVTFFYKYATLKTKIQRE